MGISIAFVGVSDRLGRGKMTYNYFLPPFEKKPRGVRRPASSLLLIAISYFLVGNTMLLSCCMGEVQARKDLQWWNTLVEAERAAKKRGTAIAVHSPEIGRIIADKTLTNDALRVRSETSGRIA
ncbi:MAG: hypothetical protein E7813_16005 [Bradyrhizobium sp.]|uniref:hypothetical protein n=1 Tax=Bradyrhizobium sp. TaxID=376 RepID=UPI00121BE6F0|nr:hypothetical protein [Bradyrhizobium sp.]THD65086.1 MAG: hypothetical protein E7813_16005 [Bradyrhizobium sp.]